MAGWSLPDLCSSLEADDFWSVLSVSLSVRMLRLGAADELSDGSGLFDLGGSPFSPMSLLDRAKRVLVKGRERVGVDRR